MTARSSSKPACIDFRCGLRHGLCRWTALVVPVQYLNRELAHTSTITCARASSGRSRKRPAASRPFRSSVRRCMWSVILHLLANGHCLALPNQASPASCRSKAYHFSCGCLVCRDRKRETFGQPKLACALSPQTLLGTCVRYRASLVRAEGAAQLGRTPTSPPDATVDVCRSHKG